MMDTQIEQMAAPVAPMAAPEEQNDPTAASPLARGAVDGDAASIADSARVCYESKINTTSRQNWVGCNFGRPVCGHPAKHQLSDFPPEIQHKIKTAWAQKHNKMSFDQLSVTKQGELCGKRLCVANDMCVEGLSEWLSEFGLERSVLAHSCFCLICQHQWKLDAKAAADKAAADHARANKEAERKRKKDAEEAEKQARKEAKDAAALVKARLAAEKARAAAVAGKDVHHFSGRRADAESAAAGPHRERCTSTSPVCCHVRHHLRTVLVVHLTKAAVATTLPLVSSMRATMLIRLSLGSAAPLLYHQPHALHAAVASAQSIRRARRARMITGRCICHAQRPWRRERRSCCDCQADLL